jgi:hypothetical protein
MDITTNNLKLFLNEMSEKLEKEQVSQEELQTLGEFYMLCKFKKEYNALKDEELSEKDMIKFLVLGWYFYCILLKKPKNE